MYIAYLDEADHTAKNSFTICGLTAIPIEKLIELDDAITKLRSEAGYCEVDLLKFATPSRPTGCSQSDHSKLKENVISEAQRLGVVFFGYGFFNEEYHSFDADRNRIFGFNTLLSKFHSFLEDTESFATVNFDRLDFSKKSKSGFKNGFEFMKQKFQQGNDHSGTFKELPRILSYGMVCEGTSHFASINDVLTGSLRYLANGSNHTARKHLQKALESVLWSDASGVFREKGFTLRPLNKSKLKASVRSEYEELRGFLNSHAK